MRNILLFTLLYFCTHTIGAEQTVSISDLEQKVHAATNAAERIDAQNRLSWALFEADSTQKAKKLLLETEQLARKTNNHTGLATCLDIQGEIYESRYDYENAMNVYVQALQLRDGATQIDKTKIAASKTRIGRIFLKEEEYDKAIEQLQESLAIQESATSETDAVQTHQLLGDAYLSIKRFGSAKNHYKRALDLNIKLQDLLTASDLASKLGQIESTLGAYDSALTYYNMSLDLHRSLDDLPRIAQDYEQIAQTYFARSATDEAIEANHTAISIWKELDAPIRLANAYTHMAKFKYETNRKGEAKRYLQKAGNLLSNANNAPDTYHIYKAIARTYDKLGDYKKAYQYHNRYTVSKDAFFTQEKKKALLEMETAYSSKFEAEQKQQMIQQLEMEQATSRRVRSFLIALIGLIGALAATLYYSYRQKKRDNEALQERNQKIEQQKFEIDAKNIELEEKNKRLDALNTQLVNEMAERESIEQTTFARDRFLAGMSHEMRTPMNAIVGLTHLLLEENPQANQIEHLQNLLFSANNLTVFINDILDFSKIEAGKLTIESRVFQPKKVFDEIFFRFKKPIENQEVTFKYNYDERIPDQLLGDPARINQIVHNLLSNALHKTTNGHIQLSLFLEEYAPQSVLLCIDLKDTGSGLSKDEISKMFSNYWEQHEDIYDGYERSRMGLAMAKRLTDLQNGKLEVETSDNGTHFIVRIPCKQVQQALKEQPNQQVSIAQNLDNQRILVVEDNKINQLVVARLLQNLGAMVTVADDGKQALDIIQNTHFDLVLMDIQMPVMDGYKATAQIRNMADPQKRNVPIIALTASAFLSKADKAKLFGMNDHVGKPFGPEDLLEKIHTCLKNKQPHAITEVKPVKEGHGL